MITAFQSTKVIMFPQGGIIQTYTVSREQ